MFRESTAAYWGRRSLVLLFLLLRLVVIYAAARKAFSASSRLRAVAWSAAAGAASILMVAGDVTLGHDAPRSQLWEEWGTFIATHISLAAAWYGVLAVSLYRPGGRSSHEQRDYRVALAGLWIAAPAIASHLALMHVWRSDAAYPACLALVRTTRALFGHRDWFEASFLDWFEASSREARGLGGWIYSRSHYAFLLSLQLALACFLPIAMALESLLRVLARRRWLHFVALGRIPGWCLREVTEQWPAGLPVLTGNGGEPVNVLARNRDTTDPLRAGGAEPVALVARPRARRSRTPRKVGSTRE